MDMATLTALLSSQAWRVLLHYEGSRKVQTIMDTYGDTTDPASAEDREGINNPALPKKDN